MRTPQAATQMGSLRPGAEPRLRLQPQLTLQRLSASFIEKEVRPTRPRSAGWSPGPAGTRGHVGGPGLSGVGEDAKWHGLSTLPKAADLPLKVQRAWLRPAWWECAAAPAAHHTPLRPSPWLEAVELWEMLLDTLGPGPWSHPLRASGPRRSEADFRRYHPRLLERGYQIMLGSILLPPELGGSCAPQGGHMAGEPGQGPTMPPSGWVSESPS